MNLSKMSYSHDSDAFEGNFMARIVFYSHDIEILERLNGSKYVLYIWFRNTSKSFTRKMSYFRDPQYSLQLLFHWSFWLLVTYVLQYVPSYMQPTAISQRRNDIARLKEMKRNPSSNEARIQALRERIRK